MSTSSSNDDDDDDDDDGGLSISKSFTNFLFFSCHVIISF